MKFLYNSIRIHQFSLLGINLKFISIVFFLTLLQSLLYIKDLVLN